MTGPDDRLESKPSIVIAGAGLVGSLLSGILARRGFDVTVFDKRPDPRSSKASKGRTIAMSLSNRGWRALGIVGLDKAVRAQAHPKSARCVHQQGGPELSQPYGRDGDALWTVNRRELNAFLVEAALRTDRVRFHFDTRIEGLDLTERTVRVCGDEGGAEAIRFDYLLGADGMNSRVRAGLRDAGVLEDVITTLDYQYFEVEVPARSDGGWALPGDHVHVWPREDRLLVALPNAGGTFSGTIFSRREVSFDEASCPIEDRTLRFRETFDGLAELVPDLSDQLAVNPPSDIRQVRCTTWNVGDRVLLIGDSCHAIVPFYAMGMNTGFEDCTVFDELLDECRGDLGQVIQRFPGQRKPDTDAIGDLSLRNFQSIGKSIDPDYHRHWLLERVLWSLFPERWTPLYAMIHFSHLRLSEVMTQHKAQSKALAEIVTKFSGDPESNRERLRAIAEPLIP